jgi:hypothetical protein
MNPSEFTDEELASWREALREQYSLEGRLQKARDEGDALAFVTLLNELEEACTRADLLLASAVERKCVRERLRDWLEDNAAG